MPRPNLFEREGQPAEEWRLPQAELQKRIKVATAEARRFSKTLKLRPLERQRPPETLQRKMH